MSVVLYVQPPVTSFTAAGWTITQTGVTVPDDAAARVIAAAQAENTPIFIGGTAADLEPVGPAWYNPGTGAPTTGTWEPGQIVVDSTGAMFIRSANGSWATPNGVGAIAAIDGGSSSAEGVRVQLRRNTASGWATDNPVLPAGEPGFEEDTGNLKIGDGATVWNLLGYVNAAELTGLATLPVGGTTGQVLDKLSNADGDVGWITPTSIPAQTGNSGKVLQTNGSALSWAALSTTAPSDAYLVSLPVLSTGLIRTAGSYSASSNTVGFGATVNRGQAVPVALTRAGTFSIGVQVTTVATAGGVIRIALWTDDGLDVPTTFVADLGTVACTSTGIIYCPSTVTLAANTKYWVLVENEVAYPVLRSCPAAAAFGVGYITGSGDPGITARILGPGPFSANSPTITAYDVSNPFMLFFKSA